MARYIDADALLLEDFTDAFVDIYDVRIFEHIIEDAPTADVVEVKHGEWVEKDCITESNRGRTIHYVTNKCSVCGKWNGRHKSNYCPHCGAKMDGGVKQ